MGHVKIKDLLDIYNCGCGPFFVLLLTDKHLKWQSKADFVYVFQQRASLRLRMMRSIKHRF